MNVINVDKYYVLKRHYWSPIVIGLGLINVINVDKYCVLKRHYSLQGLFSGHVFQVMKIDERLWLAFSAVHRTQFPLSMT